MHADAASDPTKFWWTLELTKERTVSHILLSASTPWDEVQARVEDWGVSVVSINTTYAADVKAFFVNKIVTDRLSWAAMNARMQSAAPSSAVASAGVFQLGMLRTSGLDKPVGVPRELEIDIDTRRRKR
ncbi:hypothetical protein BV25DRAFT_1839122 [Artomyces pyxidatus]|uniref:Uncharacterized protein n=1 Tax=Artomyces pyxidatus TaxID=48021 RepID=A0ACB8SZS5_9AGAM|nr:hypothetical protein BV25DRAFT_1839122 [Artomyces pyxidatus]